MDMDKIEKMIEEKGLSGQRVTSDMIEDLIELVHYHLFDGTTTMVCCLVLTNGFTVTGESACADPNNFDLEVGQAIAYTRAREKIWALEGYMLRSVMACNENR